ncbi:MAG: DUF2818 family protein, partial [Pseudomonadota bacterium]
MQNFILIVGLAALAANLPFCSERWFLIWQSKSEHKPFSIRLSELVLLYLLLGGLAYWLVGRVSSVHQQNWPFYASTFAMFLV